MLTRDHGCIRALAWNAGVPVDCDVGGLADRLCLVGFSVARVVGGFVLLRDGEGNEVAIVARTQRVQIRVSYVVPEGERRREAEKVYAVVLRALLEPPSRSALPENPA